MGLFAFASLLTFDLRMKSSCSSDANEGDGSEDAWSAFYTTIQTNKKNKK